MALASQQCNVPCLKAEMVQEGFEDLTNEPLSSPNLKHLWHVLNKQVPNHEGLTIRGLKGSAAHSFGANSVAFQGLYCGLKVSIGSAKTVLLSNTDKAIK